MSLRCRLPRVVALPALALGTALLAGCASQEPRPTLLTVPAAARPAQGASVSVITPVPRQPGATSLTLLNGENKVIMQRHVIVASPKEQYIRVRRSCINGGNDCAPTRVYYCPDMCHEVQIMAGQGGASTPTTISSSASPEAGGDMPSEQIDGTAPAAVDDTQSFTDPDLNDDNSSSDDGSSESSDE